MEKDGNRLLLGVAAIAIVVAAFGTVYVRSSGQRPASTATDSTSGRIALAGYRPERNATSDAVRQRVRNYQTEVNAALTRSGANPTAPAVGADDAADDDLFDIDPLDDTEPYPLANEGVVPSNPATPTDSNPTAVSTDGPVAQNPPANDPNGQPAYAGQAATQQNASAYEDYAQTGAMSDTDVYRLVVNNLDGEQRDRFIQAYAAMSADQRADLLDGFRQQIQGGE